ncbi:MAG: fumarylacetoacetate hydrolase family protein [Chloroflexi bacterium]|nr:fumarylacetoacetate hydrolase family protein [Chloroflexota bacterium]
MKLATYMRDESKRVGVVNQEQVYDLADCLHASGLGDPKLATDMITLLSGGQSTLISAQAAIDWAQQQGDTALVQPLAQVKLSAPLPCPGKLLCLAGNYASHIMEGGGPSPEKAKMIPRFFMKPCTAVIGTGDTIRIPPSAAFADWELELAVVIGKAGRDLSVEQAADHIAGYTIFNDISARELTFRQQLPLQEGDWFFDWLVGKWVDTFGPMGPWITTADEIAQPNNLHMQLWYNGELQQDANTGQMIFSPAEAIAFISQFITLNPGDIISTGTPAGVGHSKKLRLKAGDQIRGMIEGLGVIENPVARLAG